MKTHELKTWPSFFEAVLNGTKTFECRKNDRDFAPGDALILREFEPTANHGYYTGREMKKVVGFVVQGGVFGIEPGHCVMALLSSPSKARDAAAAWDAYKLGASSPNASGEPRGE